MDAPVFYGQFEVAIDDKARLLIPAAIRKRINPELHGQAFFLVPSDTGRPWMYTDKYYEALAQSPGSVAIGRQISESDRGNFALAELVEVDKQGRILLPTRTFEWTGLQKNSVIFLCGNRHHLELWDRASWDIERKAMLARSGNTVIHREVVATQG